MSKFLSFVLRHQPEAIGLSLHQEGWANISELITKAASEGYVLDLTLIKTLVNESDKKRFQLSSDALFIRAAQGHSTSQVNITFIAATPPDVLYHGTATRFISLIDKSGLVAKDRQYVHLSTDIATAQQVGQRHGKPVVLGIDALAMHQQAFPFYQADNGVWLTHSVPSAFLRVLE